MNKNCLSGWPWPYCDIRLREYLDKTLEIHRQRPKQSDERDELLEALTEEYKNIIDLVKAESNSYAKQ
jgi:hypothetical protein